MAWNLTHQRIWHYNVTSESLRCGREVHSEESMVGQQEDTQAKEGKTRGSATRNGRNKVICNGNKKNERTNQKHL